MQHAGELTFFVTLLAAVSGRVGAAAAAETLFAATAATRAALQNRLNAALRSPPAHAAADYFEQLARIRELLTRARELAATLVAADVRGAYLARLSALQDGARAHRPPRSCQS